MTCAKTLSQSSGNPGFGAALTDGKLPQQEMLFGPKKTLPNLRKSWALLIALTHCKLSRTCHDLDADEELPESSENLRPCAHVTRAMWTKKGLACKRMGKIWVGVNRPERNTQCVVTSRSCCEIGTHSKSRSYRRSGKTSEG